MIVGLSVLGTMTAGAVSVLLAWLAKKAWAAILSRQVGRQVPEENGLKPSIKKPAETVDNPSNVVKSSAQGIEATPLSSKSRVNDWVIVVL